METIGERVKELIGILRQNPNSFAKKIGVSTTVIYNIIGGRKSSPGFEILEKMKVAFPNINMNWLIRRENGPLTDSENVPEISSRLSDLNNRMQQFEKLNEIRDNYILVLKNKVDKLKTEVERSKIIKKGPSRKK